MKLRAVVLLLILTLSASAHAQKRRSKSPATPAPPGPEMRVRRDEVRAAIEAWQLARARQLATRKGARDPQLAALVGEIDILELKPAEAARRLAPLAASDRRSAWFATLAQLAAGNPKAGAAVRALAAGTKPGEEPLAELAWLLEGTLPRVGTTTPAQLEEAASAALNEKRKPEAALALFACRRLGQETAKLQVLLDRLTKPAPAGPPR